MSHYFLELLCRSALRFLVLAGGLVAAFGGDSIAAPEAQVTIDATEDGPRVNPRMYGIFLEEINHAVDGGLYAELIRNRGFEDVRPPKDTSSAATAGSTRTASRLASTSLVMKSAGCRFGPWCARETQSG